MAKLKCHFFQSPGSFLASFNSLPGSADLPGDLGKACEEKWQRADKLRGRLVRKAV